MTTEGGKIKFVEYHQPDLADGDYTLTVKQHVKAEQQISDKQNFGDVFPDAILRFSVLGPRFSLDPQVIDAVFPPAGSLGDHSNVLPHVVLNRSTLPWERTAVSRLKEDSGKLKEEKAKLPWLVLLLFEEGELAPVSAAQETSRESLQTFSVGELRTLITGKIKWPGISEESGQNDDDRLSVIDVPWSLLRTIMPAGEDLKFLAHVRETQEATGKPGEVECAVIMGSRVPKAGSISCVHLVSVEGRYKYEGDQLIFDDQGAQNGDSIRLVSLKTWRFTCAGEQHGFTGLLSHLDHSSPLRIPDLQPPGADSLAVDFAKRHLAMGCVPLPHAMRQGNKTFSWYRGPLAPGRTKTAEFSLPIRTADELVYYDDAYGMFDVSYAAAWELGRLLALQSKSFSTSLYHWKRTHARKLKDADAQLAHLPFDGPSADLELPESVSSWFENLTFLEGVPFHYLVPDERMLPAESIRFFQVDPVWMECLVDGAFSVGRVLQADYELDQSQKESHINGLLPNQVSGFLVRSDAVAGWPGLQVDGYDEPIKTEDFLPEKSLLFEIDPADCVSELNKKKISAKLKQNFQASKSDLSKENCAIECRQWLISNGPQNLLLSKRENNEVDVCSAADTKYLFRIDGGFKTDLNAGKVSTDLRQAFRDQSIALQQDSSVSGVSWFIGDNEHQKHYLIQNEGKTLKVYRDYKLPLLRMARLSANVLICLFEGIVQTVDLHLKPETLHLGLDKAKAGLHKKVKNLPGRNASLATDSVPIPWRDQAKQVINIARLAEEIKKAVKAQKFSAAEFALEMIEGVEKVRFSALT